MDPGGKAWEMSARLCGSERKSSPKSVLRSSWTESQAQSAEVSFATAPNWLTWDFPTVSSFYLSTVLVIFHWNKKKDWEIQLGLVEPKAKTPLVLGLDSPEGEKRCQLQLMWAVSLAHKTSGYSRCDNMNYLQLRWTTCNRIIACTPWWELAALISLTVEGKDRKADLEMTAA